MREEFNQAQKRNRLKTTHTEHKKEANQLAIDAEKNMLDLVKSNDLRSKAKEKMLELQIEEDKIRYFKDKLNKL